jgi:2'-5' RNA ligase
VNASEPSEILAYWLIPAQPVRDYFAAMIAELASRFAAPIFEPHVTVYASSKGQENPREILISALASCGPFRISIRAIRSSVEFTRTVFVQFESSRELSQLSRRLQNASASRDRYPLDPHLSLMYKKLPRATTIELASSIRLPFTEVLFDSVKAIVCPTPIKTGRDVEAWRVVASQPVSDLTID